MESMDHCNKCNLTSPLIPPMYSHTEKVYVATQNATAQFIASSPDYSALDSIRWLVMLLY